MQQHNTIQRIAVHFAEAISVVREYQSLLNRALNQRH